MSDATTVHIGYDDHISGFILDHDDLGNLLACKDSEAANDYIIEHGERTETNEADLFLNMMDPCTVEFDEFLDNVRFWKFA